MENEIVFFDMDDSASCGSTEVIGSIAECLAPKFDENVSYRDMTKRANSCGTPEIIKGGLAGWQIRRVTEHIDAQLGTHISVLALSKIAMLSAAHFARTFRASFGTSPHRYIIGRRLRRASILMATTSLQFCDISAVCGFADQPHFCKTFKKHYSETPQGWRKHQSRAKVEAADRNTFYD